MKIKSVKQDSMLERHDKQVRQETLRKAAEYEVLINASDDASFKSGVKAGIMLYQRKLKAEAAKLDAPKSY